MKDALPLNEAQRLVLHHAVQLGTEHINLLQALGRVLANDIRSNRDHPPCDISAMDGYAVRAADLRVVPAQLFVVADIKAGDLPTLKVEAGQCARIMTGAPIPQGADTVIRVEDTQAIATDKVQINVSANAGKDIRCRAENLRTNEVILTAGTEINPGALGILAMVKSAEVQVRCRPSIAILSSGDELEGLHDAFDMNKIPDANSYALMAQVQALGIVPTLLGIARDDPNDLREKLEQGLQYDVLLVSGGTSVGVHDFVRPTLAQLGVQMHFWRVQMRPGQPVAFGTTKQCKVFCLPGNPVSSMVCFEQLVTPALRNMMGYARIFRRILPVRLAQAVAHRPGHVEFVRVVLSRDASGYFATPTGSQSSGVLLSMARADALLIVPSGSNGLAAGDEAIVQLLDSTEFEEDNGSIE
jgi:molybdopterin molybdotransferase